MAANNTEGTKLYEIAADEVWEMGLEASVAPRNVMIEHTGVGTTAGAIALWQASVDQPTGTVFGHSIPGILTSVTVSGADRQHKVTTKLPIWVRRANTSGIDFMFTVTPLV